MRKYCYIIGCIVITVACKNNNPIQDKKVNEQQLIYNLKVLSHDSLEGRFFGTEGNYKAQRFIAKQFDSLGIEPAFPSGSIQQYPYTFTGKYRQQMYPISDITVEDLNKITDTTVIGGNVVTMIKGKHKKAIVITGHLDHLGIQNGLIFNGADDDASGAAALLAIASYFKDKSPEHTLIFAAVDAEEIGSLGCDYLLNNFPIAIENIALNINMDMIGRNDALELYASGIYHYPHLKLALDNLKQTKIKLLYGHDDPNYKQEQDWTFSSDHREFHKRQIPYIYFGVEDHKDYHKSTDTFEAIHKEFYVDAVTLIIEAIENYDSFLSKEPKV